LHLEKDFSPEQLVTIKLLDKLRTTNLRHQTQTYFCHFRAVSLSGVGWVLCLPVGKVAFACYSRFSRSSL